MASSLLACMPVFVPGSHSRSWSSVESAGAAGRRLPSRARWSVDERAWRAKLQPQSFNAETAGASSPSFSSSSEDGPPIIQLEFLEPESRYEPQTFSAVSGEKNLRKFMLEKKLEVYALYGKVMNCGGGGSCGTCIVEILEGQDLLSEKTDAEYKSLKKKPESWRLACQTIIGDKINSGKVVVQQLPQKKKK